MTQKESERGEVSSPGADLNVAVMATGGVALLLSLGTLLLWDGRAALGVFVGGLLGVGNLWAFKRIGHGFFAKSGTSRALWGLVGAGKFVVLMLVVGLLLKKDIVQGIPLLIGYGALPIGTSVSGLLLARVQKES